MLTRQEGERLAQSINAIRPEWPVASLLTIISKRKDRPLLDLALELMYVALDPDTKSPARIDVDGPWKRLNHSATAIAYRTIGANDCGICLRPQQLHSLVAGVDDHEWEPQRPTVGVGPTAEQRAAIDKAAEEAQLAATAAREETVKRTPRDPNEVISEHVNERKSA